MPPAILTAHLDLDLSGLDRIASFARRRAAALAAVRAGARPVIARARALAPKRKLEGGGALKRSIGVKVMNGKKAKSNALAVIGARRSVITFVTRGQTLYRHIPGNISHLVEFGTRAHSVSRGAKLARKGKASQRDTGQSGAMHPGAKAAHFMRSAWDAARGQALKIMRDRLAVEINKAVAKEVARQAKKAKGK